jgi:tetratricopeptide (TPR) repeat protein
MITAIMFLSLCGSAYAAKTIGVTQFKNLTGDKEVEWLGVGIAESITQKLSRVKDYILIERINVDKIIGEIALGQTGVIDENSAKKAGKALGADIIIIGNYQKYSNQVKIIAKFVETESHKILKQAEARGVMDNIFDLQDEIALKLIQEDDVEISTYTKEKITKKYTTSITAYEYYVRGQDSILKKTDYDTAIEMFNKAVSIDRNYSLAYSGLGKAYSLKSWALRTYSSKTDKSLLEKAYTNSKKALELYPDLDEAHLSLSRFYQEADEDKYPDKWDLCEQEAKKAIEINPNNGEAYFVLSRRFGYDDKLEEQYLLQTLEKNRFIVDAHNNLGVVYLDRNELELAEKYFKSAVEIDPTFSTGYMNLGVVYDRRKEYTKALDMYKIVVEKYPRYIRGLLNLGIGYENLKQYDLALEQYTKAKKINPDDYEPWSKIAYIYVLRKDYKEAIKNYQKSLKLNGEYYYSLANIGYSYCEMEKYNEGIPYIEKAHNLNTGESWPATYLGWVYRYKKNDNAKAKYWYEETLKRDPNNSEAKTNLEELSQGQ